MRAEAPALRQPALSQPALSQKVRRRVFMVLSPRALSYARFSLESLLRNHVEPMDLFLITDSVEDKRTLQEHIDAHLKTLPAAETWGASVHSFADLEEREAEVFGAYPRLRAFRAGHPCWRKITDPLLLSATGGESAGGNECARGEEMVLLDPDLYFPNRFTFEATPAEGLLLMWQPPSCLLPDETVRRAMNAGIPLAHHVDIGVAQWRVGEDRAGADLDWLDWLLGRLGAPDLPHMMHVEAIVWAALAMRIGGGYLDADHWVCWQRTQRKRLERRLGVSGLSILRREKLAGAKCFHAGGEAKTWLAEGYAAGILDRGGTLTEPGRQKPFEELRPPAYRREQQIKGAIRRLGYYKVFQS
jgi:hypothetical protein